MYPLCIFLVLKFGTSPLWSYMEVPPSDITSHSPGLKASLSSILIIAEINCGSPGILPNGWLEGTRTTLHAVVTFRCQEGMTFEGPSYRTICQADGRWSHPLPRCYGE